ncbi:Glycosyltransferase family 61 protein [Rhynchospora pubera]|uniref:Glycosyltransferase family 61 protein n=1 Tax=Rhynchospora pubera TaxID=906938 RepID=A0AAV8AL05_9POAL|nr:Glycosyltransferase family 61 protein [Rhynchospora pubera]KAJ4788628.1 Glycosyltransferase family 61 protein [Rhynchospora pubera]
MSHISKIVEMKNFKNLKNMNWIFSEKRFVSLAPFLVFVLVIVAFFTLPDQFTLRAFNSLSGEQYINGTYMRDDGERLTEPVKETKREDRQQTTWQEVNEIVQKHNSSEINHSNEYNGTDNSHVEGSPKNVIEQTPPKPICDNSNWRYEACDITGDARTFGIFSTVFYVPPPQTINPAAQNWTFGPQSRRAVQAKNVTVKSLFSSLESPPCSIKNNMPAIVFALGCLTGNLWHDFSDVLIPLFINSRTFDGEVQFLITDMHTWFLQKYHLVFKKLSQYEIINFDMDSEVRCYPRVMVGLQSHKDLGIDPKRTPNGYNLFDFKMFIRDAFSLPPAFDIPFKLNTNPKRKPRVMLVLRNRSRRFMNGPEIVQAVQNSGFEVLPVEPTRDMNITEFSRVVDSCDVLMGAHGAALTNIMFLRTNALMIQIVPYGKMERDADNFYSKPAAEMKLRHLEYSISAEETTLLEKYGWDNPVISDPESIHKQGWKAGMRYYWIEQDIKLNLTRFAPVLVKAQQLLRE